MPLNEFDLIKKYFTRQFCQSTVVHSVGDDCAIVAPTPDKQLVMSMDTLVIGTHFPETATAYQIATRALCTSLSDLAAMGAKPLWFTLGLTLPNVDEEWLSSFSEGLFFIANQFDIDLIGGDTTRGPLTVTIQVHGQVDKNTALMRSAAKVGDRVLVTDTVGDGAAALAILQGKHFLDESIKEYLLKRFYQPLPQIAVGMELLPFVNAAIDISDGLVADAGHIAEASDVTIQLDVDAIPVYQQFKNHPEVDVELLLNWALSGGDDYQLLMTAEGSHLDKITTLCRSHGVDITAIGQVTGVKGEQPSVELISDGNRCDMSQIMGRKGYQHFDA